MPKEALFIMHTAAGLYRMKVIFPLHSSQTSYNSVKTAVKATLLLLCEVILQLSNKLALTGTVAGILSET